MSDPDPLEELLYRAVAADRARTVTPDVAPAVVRRVRLHQRLRGFVLGGAACAGLLLFALSGADLSALTTMLWGMEDTLVPGGWTAATPDLWSTDPTLIAALVLAGLACLAALGEGAG